MQLKIAGLTLAVGTAGGFTIGLLHGSVIFLDEVEKPLLKYREILIGYTRYFYDNRGRIVRMVQYTPVEKPAELVVVTYEYREDNSNPIRTVFNSIPEKKTREISFDKEMKRAKGKKHEKKVK